MTNKQRLQNILKNPKGKVICVDLDGTLALGTYWGKKHPKVNEAMAKFVRNLDDGGATIIIYTARPVYQFSQTYKWLGQNNLLYPLAMRIKPPASLYLDDKALNVDDLNLK